MAINIIAAIGKNNELGKDNDLTWKIKDDLKFFREKTINHTVVMGRNTMLSIPNGFLDHRENCVISKTLAYEKNCRIFRSINEFLNLYDDFWIIGGSKVYNDFLKLGHVDYALVTFVKHDYNADIFLDNSYLEKFSKKIMFDSAKYKILEYSKHK